MRLGKNRYRADDEGWLNEKVCLAIILVATTFLVGIVLLAMMTPEP